MLRHRTLSPTIYLSEVIHKPFALSRVSLLSRGGKSAILVKTKAPSCSGFPPSMYVVLKTRYVNPISTYVDIRSTYIVQTYQPLVHNFYPYVEQQPNRGYFTKLYGISPKLYTFLHHPNIALPTYSYWGILCAYHRMTPTYDLHINSFVRESLPYWRREEVWHPL